MKDEFMRGILCEWMTEDKCGELPLVHLTFKPTFIDKNYVSPKLVGAEIALSLANLRDLKRTRAHVISKPIAWKVIFHDPATIVFWNDGTKTVVKCQEGDTYDREAGLAMCYMKKVLGTSRAFNDILKFADPDYGDRVYVPTDPREKYTSYYGRKNHLDCIFNRRYYYEV